MHFSYLMELSNPHALMKCHTVTLIVVDLLKAISRNKDLVYGGQGWYTFGPDFVLQIYE